MSLKVKSAVIIVIVYLLFQNSLQIGVWAGTAKKGSQRSSIGKHDSKPEVELEKLEYLISKYERLYSNNDCDEKQTERCADILFDLAKLRYDYQRSKYVRDMNEYDKLMKKWEKRQEGESPVSPIPDYSQPLATFRKLAEEYPDFEKIDQVYYQIGHLCLLGGEMDKSQKAFKDIVDKTPDSRLVSAAYFRLSDFAYMDNDHVAALKYLNKIKREEVNEETWEMTHYRKGECYLHTFALDLAVNQFFTYVEKCDRGEYIKKELRDEALENLAAAFADMPEGATEAAAFFKKHNDKSFEPFIIYKTGMKNRNHGQFEQAIKALKAALERYPCYRDAPLAHNMLVECYVIKKKYKKANECRIKLIKDYSKGTWWYAKNRRDKKAVAVAREYIKKALGNICIYFHAEAQKKKKRELYEKALAYYEKFLGMFPDEKWRVYEFQYNIAEIFAELKQYKKAAQYYWNVATEDLSGYPPMEKEELDENLYDDPTELEKEKKRQGSKGASLAFTQADAANNSIAVLNKLREQVISVQHISEKGAYYYPITQEVLIKCHEYRKLFPRHPNTPRILYLAGTIRYNGEDCVDALKDFSLIVTDYFKSDKAVDASRMMAKSFTALGRYNWALTEYRRLLERKNLKPQDYDDIVDLAAGVLYTKADKMRSYLSFQKAAEIFKSILKEFPQSKITDRAWFDAGVCYEKAEMFETAAKTFEELPKKFTKSGLRKKAFFRAAENYKKIEKWGLAASALATGAAAIPDPDFAIPGFSSAAEYCDKSGDFRNAGSMYESIAQRYPNDKRAPLALYNAALSYEKGGLWDQAIAAYRTLVNNYPGNEYAEDAAFAQGICLEKQGKRSEAAVAFISFSARFNKSEKKVEALKRAGTLYYEQGNNKEAKDAFNSAIALCEQMEKGSEESCAHAHFMLGQVLHDECNTIKLTGRTEKKVIKNLEVKTAKLEEALKHYTMAIKTGVQEWVFKANCQIGISFVDFAGDVKVQRIFAKDKTRRMAAEIDIRKQLERYYREAQGKFAWNIQKAREQKVKSPVVDSSVTMFIRMSYLQGQVYEEIAHILATHPVPGDLHGKDSIEYIDKVEEAVLGFIDEALKRYGEGVKLSRKLKIDKNPDLDIIVARIREINPLSKYLDRETTAFSSPDPADTNDLFIKGVNDSIQNTKEGETSVEHFFKE